MGSLDRQNSTPQLLNRVRMRQVALMLAVEERRTLRAAADQLGLTQPAATKMLHELESALGQPLFDRVGRGLQLNAAGERVMGYFRGIRGSMEALNRELHEFQLGSVGKFSLGSIMAASPGRLTDALTALKAAHPLLAMEIAVDTSDRLLAQLHEGVLEVVVGRPVGIDAAACTFKAIADEALAVVVGNEHPLARQARVAFADLLDYPWILQPAHSPMREVIEREFQSHHAMMPRGLIETGSILTTINLIRKSQMIGVIPTTVARRDAEHGVLSIVRYPIRQKLATYGSIVRSDRPLSTPARQFLDLLHGIERG
ncbi:LysR family transcriptional regulator [Variovorax sp. J22G21]|uniref:LysR family transcriptional regulator n=1 Tax=Variovorax fucosicus TaxID=3053517 RepID=UPI002575699C|nr:MULTISPECIES: LysR family transcriptional regulator [unclassified Variovorax]MDM0042235.1 LysR family transcriptional regulator [Variovorax sp. J22R193]MDM0058145.1 LysR family transcriptional regulator [Variovorax sp. J22G47]MDM0060839.1 LysR family transcriptional regulator [Variovorax sp. J22G21]